MLYLFSEFFYFFLIVVLYILIDERQCYFGDCMCLGMFHVDFW